MLGGYPPIHLCYLTDFPLEKMVLVVFEAATSSRAPAMAPASRTMHAVSTGRSIAGLKKTRKIRFFMDFGSNPAPGSIWWVSLAEARWTASEDIEKFEISTFSVNALASV